MNDLFEDTLRQIIIEAYRHKRRSRMKDLLRYFVGIYGESIGLVMVLLVSIWDVLRIGVRGFFEYKVGVMGIIIIWAGLILIVLSKHWDRRKW